MRRFLIVLLGIGAVAGFASGFARLWHCHHDGYGYGRGGHYGWYDERAEFEDRVADVCLRAAERQGRGRPGEAARPPAPPQ